ncbi:glutathione S-transferase family protein [Methylomonas sp. UP202]|uniref:glutathione S-transferase family protein n=1 Tax=Methylomonas sp. UP202 TaxID=3040943 RepID=UPI00247A0926|nr:glutathione S-transferase family protein [Methylomonas sp. UP202]WGS83979.1 glutathione S-transferase family protein [Methylomonas sp. UP202]
MYELYIANKNYSSWSLRPWVLMRELGIPFVEKLVPFAETDQPNPFRSFSPTGKVPCLIDGETVVWDSLAITEYLAERSPAVWPADAASRTWARCAAAEMHSGLQTLRECCTMNCGLRIRTASPSHALAKDLARLNELWLDGLTRFGGPYLAGPAFTAVDAFFAPVAFRVQTYGLELAPACRAYADRLLALPAMQDWYAAALNETWRDEEHEQMARKAGTWLHDYRAAGS